MFAPADAKRYASELSDGRLVLIEDAYSFTPEDQPERLSEQIAAFVHGRPSIKQTLRAGLATEPRMRRSRNLEYVRACLGMESKPHRRITFSPCDRHRDSRTG